MTTSLKSDTEPSYAPDGSALAFINTRSGATEIWVQRILGSPGTSNPDSDHERRAVQEPSGLGGRTDHTVAERRSATATKPDDGNGDGPHPEAKL